MRPIFSIFFFNKVTVGPVNSIVNSVICLKKKKMREEKKKKLKAWTWIQIDTLVSV